jgi:ferredoxin
MKNCERTLEGCLFMGDLASRGVKEGWAQPISHEDALAALGRAFDDGLVLIAADIDRDLWKICACCSCCCFMFAAYQRFGGPNSFVASPMATRRDEAACEACGACVERCHFHALTREGDAVRFDAGSCFGCGVCQPACPNDALTLVPRA